MHSREKGNPHYVLLPHKALNAFNVQVYLLVQLVGTRNIVAQDVLQLQRSTHVCGSMSGAGTSAQVATFNKVIPNQGLADSSKCHFKLCKDSYWGAWGMCGAWVSHTSSGYGLVAKVRVVLLLML